MNAFVRTAKTFSLTAIVLFAALGGGCTPRTQEPRDLPAQRRTVSSFAFAGAGISASSRVERRATPGGGEALHGTTEVTLPGEAHPTRLQETAEIDASGRLVLLTSELRRGPRGGELVRSVKIDAASGRVTVGRANGETSWVVDSEYPLIYEGAFTSAAPEMASATAVQAWIARRAAEAGTRIRSVDLGDRSTHLTIPSQLVLDDGASKWVVLGDEAIEVDGDFVRELPWKALSGSPGRAYLTPGAPQGSVTPADRR